MSSIFLVGVVNALVFAVLVQTKKEKVLPDHLLSLLFLSAALLFGLVFAAFEWGYDWLLLPLEYANLFWTPSFYLYVASMIDPRHRLPRGWPAHFGMLLLAILYQAWMLTTYSEIELALIYRVKTFANRPLPYNLLYLVDLAAVPVYLALAWRLIRAHRRQIGDLFSFRQSVDYRWLVRFIVVLLLSWLLGDLPYLGTFLIGGLDERQTLALGITFSVLGILYLGFYGLRQQSVFTNVPDLSSSAPQDAEADPRYRKSGLANDELEASAQSLLAHMAARKPFLDKTLTIRDLAGSVGLTEHNLSEVLNVGLGKRFYDFVNEHRVEEFKRRAAAPEAANLTLLAIALDCGFNSKSSFNRIFKQHTGITPSAYLKSPGSPADC